MVIIVILLGMFAGWAVGAYFLDKWVNDINDEINNENK